MLNSPLKNVHEFEVTDLVTTDSGSIHFTTYSLLPSVISYLNEISLSPRMVVYPAPLEIYDDICFEGYSHTVYTIYLEMTDEDAIPFLLRFNLQG